MEKLYKVTLMDNEDGGHVLGEALFTTAKEARNEFLRIRKHIFKGFYHDQPDEYNFRYDDHFTNYHTLDLDLSIEIVKIGNKITFFENEYTEPFYRSLFNETDDFEDTSIDDIFTRAVDNASRQWSYNNQGFKQIHDYVKRCLFDSFVCCEYSKGCETQPDEMHYFVKTTSGQEAIVSVRKNVYNRSYDYCITM